MSQHQPICNVMQPIYNVIQPIFNVVQPICNVVQPICKSVQSTYEVESENKASPTQVKLGPGLSLWLRMGLYGYNKSLKVSIYVAKYFEWSHGWSHESCHFGMCTSVMHFYRETISTNSSNISFPEALFAKLEKISSGSLHHTMVRVICGVFQFVYKQLIICFPILPQSAPS